MKEESEKWKDFIKKKSIEKRTRSAANPMVTRLWKKQLLRNFIAIYNELSERKKPKTKKDEKKLFKEAFDTAISLTRDDFPLVEEEEDWIRFSTLQEARA